MKPILAAILVFSALNLVPEADGQPGRTPEEIADARTRKMTELVGLRPAQVSKVRAVNLEYARKIAAARETGQPPATINRIRYRQNQELKGLLTPNQYLLYQRSGIE